MHCYVYDTNNHHQFHPNNKRKKPHGENINRAQQLFNIMCCYFEGTERFEYINLANFLTNSNVLKNYDFYKFMENMNVCFVIYQMDESKMFLKLIDRIGSQHSSSIKIGILHSPSHNGIEEENLLLLTKTNETDGVPNYFYDLSKTFTKVQFIDNRHIKIIDLPYCECLDICNIISLYFNYTQNATQIKYPRPNISTNSDEFISFLKQHNIEIYIFNVNLEETGIICNKIIGSCNHMSTKIMILRMTNKILDFLMCEYRLIVDGIKGHEILNNNTNYSIRSITL